MADDPFIPDTPPTITGVVDIAWEVIDPHPNSGQARAVAYTVLLQLSDGNTFTRSGNLGPHLTQSEITGLQTLADRIRTKAENAWGQVT